MSGGFKAGLRPTRYRQFLRFTADVHLRILSAKCDLRLRDRKPGVRVQADAELVILQVTGSGFTE